MAARTSWNPRYERAPDYFEDDPYADSIGYDDLLDQGFDEYGRLTRRPRRQPRAHYDAMPEPQDHVEMRRAVDGLARRVEALAQQSAQRSLAGRGPGPEAGPVHERDAQSPRANATLQALDRL